MYFYSTLLDAILLYLIVMKKEAKQLLKKLATALLAILFALAALTMGQQAEAATTYIFESVTYNETAQKDGSVDRTLSKVTLTNSAGKTAAFNIDSTARLYVNNTLTTIGGFKAGMPVTVNVNLRKVTEMRGTSIDIEQGAIATNSKQQAGLVTKIDPNGLFITVKLDNAGTKTYYLNNNTNYSKGSSSVDLSTLYEGDRVKLKFSSATTSVISEIEIITAGIAIENVYKATLNSVNTTSNKFTVKNAHPFENWMFGVRTNTDQNTFIFTNSTSIYAGNKKITKNQFKNYKNSEVYYVTKKQFNSEVVSKIIVLEKNEFTFYQSLTAVNTNYNFFQLASAGRMYYHDGSILIRNGRLVEADTLAANGAAFVVTDGNTKTQYAHVVNVTNDSFTSPNLSTHQLYFGEISLADQDNYLVEFNGLEKFSNNYWTSYKDESVFAFSNSTAITEQIANTQFKVIPETELFLYESRYAYMYVKDGHVQAMHLLEDDEPRAEVTLTGRISQVKANEIKVQSVSQWVNGEWTYFGEVDVDLTKVMIIKNGKVLKASELKKSDRVVLVTNGELETHVILVN